MFKKISKAIAAWRAAVKAQRKGICLGCGLPCSSDEFFHWECER